MSTPKVINLALTGVSHSGKTTLAESLLYFANVTKTLGKVDDGTSNLDFEQEEIKRKITIKTSVATIIYNDLKLFLLDTPGDENFIFDKNMALNVVDNILFVVDATEPIKAHTQLQWRYLTTLNKPKYLILNKVDKQVIDVKSLIQLLKDKLDIKPVPFNLPYYRDGALQGFYDLFSMKYHGNMDIDENFKEDLNLYRNNLIEFTAESDDQLLEKYLEGCEFTYEQLLFGIKKGIRAQGFIPLLFISCSINSCFETLLKFIQNFMVTAEESKLQILDAQTKRQKEITPSPISPLSAIVFKTLIDPFAGKISLARIYSGTIRNDINLQNSSKNQTEKCANIFHLVGKNQKLIGSAVAGEIIAIPKLKFTETGDTLCDVGSNILIDEKPNIKPLLSYAIKPKAKTDEEKISNAIYRIIEEDPSIVLTRDSFSNELIISGCGPIHIEATLEKLQRKYGVEVEMSIPKVPYKETIKSEVKGVIYRHKKQTGGAGQFAEVHFDITPLPRGKGFEFEEALVGMNVPRNFVPAVEKGIQEALQSGPLAGFPVVDLKVRFYDGKSHEVDSSEIAFKIAAIHCMKKGLQEAKPTLLEPMVKLLIQVPDECLGDVIGDLNSKRGRVMGMNSLPYNYHEIIAIIPQAEVRTYLLDLNSLTGGRGTFTQEFSHYEEVPQGLIDKILASLPKKEDNH